MSDPMSFDEVIEHYGIKGMRWGVRRSRSELEKKSGKGKSDSSDKKKTQEKTVYQKSPSRLSDAELKRRIARMDLEKRYSDLKTAPSSKEGSKFAKGIIKDSGRNVLNKLVTNAMGLAVNTAIKKKFGEETADVLYPLGKKKKKSDK